MLAVIVVLKIKIGIYTATISYKFAIKSEIERNFICFATL